MIERTINPRMSFQRGIAARIALTARLASPRMRFTVQTPFVNGLNILKHGEGINDYLKYGNGLNDFVLYK